MSVLEGLQKAIGVLPVLARFAVLMALIRSLTNDAFVAVGIVAALVVGKWIAAESVGRAFRYTPAARLTMWSLTLPQVAATLAATLVAYKTFNAAGQPLLDGPMLNGVLIMVLVTAVLGPVLTQRFAPRLMDESSGSGGVVKAVADTRAE